MLLQASFLGRVAFGRCKSADEGLSDNFLIRLVISCNADGLMLHEDVRIRLCSDLDGSMVSLLDVHEVKCQTTHTPLSRVTTISGATRFRPIFRNPPFEGFPLFPYFSTRLLVRQYLTR